MVWIDHLDFKNRKTTWLHGRLGTINCLLAYLYIYMHVSIYIYEEYGLGAMDSIVTLRATVRIDR